MVALATTIYAQENYNKPDNSKFSLEVGFTPFNSESVILMGEQIVGTYSINDKIGIRLGLGFASETETSDNKQTNYTKRTATSTNFSITPGVKFSFAGTNKLSPYIGFEFLFGTQMRETTLERKQGDDLIKTVTTNADYPINTFGADAFTGFNYYFAKNIFVGIEIGIGANTYSVKKQSVKTTTNGATTTLDTEAESGAFTFGFMCNPAIRLGWSF